MRVLALFFCLIAGAAAFGTSNNMMMGCGEGTITPEMWRVELGLGDRCWKFHGVPPSVEGKHQMEGGETIITQQQIRNQFVKHHRIMIIVWDASVKNTFQALCLASLQTSDGSKGLERT